MQEVDAGSQPNPTLELKANGFCSRIEFGSRL